MGKAQRESIADRLLYGAIDFQVHVDPDPHRKRICDAHDLAIQAKRVGMRGIVLKSHDYPTAPLAQIIRRSVEGIALYGAVTLNPAVGGINPNAVEVSARLGARVVWMPTLHARSERQQDGIAILDEGGALLPAVRDVLALVKQYDLVLGTGHLLEPELGVLVREARRMGIERIVVTHASKIAGTSLLVALQRELADQGAVIEHSFGHTYPQFGNGPLMAMLEAFRTVGVKRCLLSTDLGRADAPPPWDGLRAGIVALLDAGMSEREAESLVKDNPRRLLEETA
jgi:hypothetical protein